MEQLINPTFEGTNFNAELVADFKSFKDFLKHETTDSVFTQFSKEDREELLKKVYDECLALKNAN